MNAIEPGTFGARVHSRRIEIGITQRELAARIGVDFSYISKIEHNALGYPPSEKTIRAIARELEEDGYTYLELAEKLAPQIKRLIEQHPPICAFLRILDQRSLGLEVWQQILALARREVDDEDGEETTAAATHTEICSEVETCSHGTRRTAHDPSQKGASAD